MRDIRVIGSTISKLINEKNIQLEELVSSTNCDYTKFRMGLMGRTMFSFQQLETIAECLGVGIEELIPGDEVHYKSAFVDCMKPFTSVKNMDDVLDIIYDYLDVVDKLQSSEKRKDSL